jgi:hypothetical protein
MWQLPNTANPEEVIELSIVSEARARNDIQSTKTADLRILCNPTMGESTGLRRLCEHVSHSILLSLSEEVAQVPLPSPRSRHHRAPGLLSLSQRCEVAIEEAAPTPTTVFLRALPDTD